MDKYTRKTKPRTARSSQPGGTPLYRLPPSHNVTPAPPALVGPVLPARVSTPDHVSPPATQERDEQVSRPTSTSLSQKPRKRFRKKVNGLFGDQTDLKRRMSKLLRETDTTALLRDDESDLTQSNLPHQPAFQPPVAVLPSPETVVRKLNEVARRSKCVPPGEKAHHTTSSPSHTVAKETSLNPSTSLDSFDSPEFVATASRALGSPARLRAVLKSMGRLSPRSNERFIDELQLGLTPTPAASQEQEFENAVLEDITEKIEPPEIPSVDSSELETENRPALLSMSPVSVERTAAPAVLRRKVRRLDRGYRSADVLRARLQGSTLSEIAASPTSRRRGEKATRWRTKIRRLDLGEGDDVVDSHQPKRQRSAASRVESQEESDGIYSDGAPPKKRKVREESERDERAENEDTYNASDPLAILVDAAAAEEQKQRKFERGGKDSSSNRTEGGTVGAGQKSSKERRRKRKSTSRQRVLVSD
ncbi:unnamed protein product [Chondrus crispus]|uniref:Uncharacterized protein n=1 Tax=Chondrus crispus TaxID=2769 RepID=R7QCZ8_CHOCR|nr:unnamed protein product [Chondrus crispus]CDF35939.1 unnamed protein product [Chondrus crispus]|eukprot:XP_005715758.1 unnamed protein product [Chondrus crispus]